VAATKAACNGASVALWEEATLTLDTAKPLIPGFHLPRPGKSILWISFRYERLGDYCTLCGLIGHKKIQCSQPPHRLCPNKYRLPLPTLSLYGLRSSLSPSKEDSDSGISSMGTSQSHSDAHSSPVHGAESPLQLVPQRLSPPNFHVSPPYNSPAMQLRSLTNPLSLGQLSSSTVDFYGGGYVASPQPFHFQATDFTTQVGEQYPQGFLGCTASSPSSWPDTLPIFPSRLSAVDKGKSPLILASPAASPLPLLSFANISHPCPITISPPLTHPAHFTDFLSKWPQPFTPCPSSNPLLPLLLTHLLWASFLL
jgi:hypothetical protein